MEIKELELEMRNLEKEKSIIDDKYNTLKRLLELYRNNNLPIDVSNVSIGDEVIIPHESMGNIPFIVIGKDHDAPNSVTLLTRDIVTCLAFDAKEPNNSDTSRQSYGNNRYKYSNILQWLNSDKAAGGWYSPQHTNDQAPSSTDYVLHNPYTNIDGLLRGFSSDIVNQMIEVPKRTVISTVDGGGYEDVFSKIFLLSRTEVGLGNKNDIKEGYIYEYFSQDNTNEQRITYPSKFAVANTDYNPPSFVNVNSSWYWWLRTPNLSKTSYAHGVNSSGNLNTHEVYLGSSGVRFALVLKK